MKLQILKSAIHLVSLLFITTISFPMASHGNSSYISISDPVVNQPLRYYDFGVPSPNADLMKKSAWKSLCIDTTRTLGERLCLPVTTRTSELSDTILYTVGQIQYEESVSSTGARTYIVPIKVSDNAVFPPSLSLCYNSQASDGIAGYSWTIGGISSIEIIHKNVYYHGEVAPADVNDSSSVYAFDGIPLVTNWFHSCQYLW
ncbi:MAG: hypothetical protein E7117_00545 [Bacteroidales bacterium]|nr:hypothetical protein [Bacteroidales bacterium]